MCEGDINGNTPHNQGGLHTCLRHFCRLDKGKGASDLKLKKEAPNAIENLGQGTMTIIRETGIVLLNMEWVHAGSVGGLQTEDSEEEEESGPTGSTIRIRRIQEGMMTAMEEVPEAPVLVALVKALIAAPVLEDPNGVEIASTHQLTGIAGLEPLQYIRTRLMAKGVEMQTAYEKAEELGMQETQDAWSSKLTLWAGMVLVLKDQMRQHALTTEPGHLTALFQMATNMGVTSMVPEEVLDLPDPALQEDRMTT